MLVRDHTPVYSSLGRWAGPVPQRMGDFGFDIDSFINTMVDTTGKVVVGIAGAVSAGEQAKIRANQPQVTYAPPYVPQTSSSPPPQAPGLPQKKWYEDPLMLGAAGLGVVGLGFVLLGRRSRRMGSLGGYRRSRRSRRSRR